MINKSVRFKHDFSADVSVPVKVPEFRPLRQWPFIAHDRQAEMDAYRSIPSVQKADSKQAWGVCRTTLRGEGTGEGESFPPDP